MRLSRRSRNSVKHKSASVEFADQTGGRVFDYRLEFNYADRPKFIGGTTYNFETMFYGAWLSFSP